MRLPRLHSIPSCRNLFVALLVTYFSHQAAAAIRVEAYRGQPFGIGRVTIDLPQDAPSTPWTDDRFAIDGETGRLLYSVMENPRGRRLLRSFLNIETPWRVTFYFMFRGDEPLSVTVHAPLSQTFDLRPRDNPREHREVLGEWWSAMSSRYETVYRESQYPLVVDNFIMATWARRLGQPMPESRTFLLRSRETGGTWISQLMAAEAYQTAVERDLLLGRFGGQPATIDLTTLNRDYVANRANDPANAMELPPPAGPLPDEIEPIAGRVPAECFYMRFGSFVNYLWFRDFMQKWQGDLGNMIVPDALTHDNRGRLQRQLALRESQVARVMGPNVIRDVAVIGFDSYMRDGASMGIMFQASSGMLLGQNLSGGRTDALANNADAKEERIEIAGRQVSYLSTPDGRLRSYYVVDGDYHFVSTSRRLVERFLAVAAGGSLAGTSDFQETRAAMPISREDTIFLHMPAAFFENLAGPQYRVELDRRLRSIGEIRSLQIARLAAAAEGRNARTVEELVAADLLPPGFGVHSDGSKLVAVENGWRDSLRGLPGALVPVADMRVDKVSPAEVERYTEFRRLIDNEVGRFAPVTFAVKRTPAATPDGLDRITADVRLAPYSPTNLVQFANRLGPATNLRVAPIAGDIASLELVLSGFGEPLHAFAGLRDFRAPFAVRQGEVAPATDWSQFLAGYVGVWPRLGLLDTLLGRPTGQFDDRGIARNNGLFDLWVRRTGDFFLFAFQRQVLLEVGPQLAMVQAERPAQAWLRVDDLSNKQIETGVSGFGYSRARAATATGSRFMNSLISQLHVPPEEAKALAEQLVGGTFVSSLGGEYALVTPSMQAGDTMPAPGERRLWASTAIPLANRFLLTEVPADYQMPLVEWFRGMNLELTRDDAADALLAHVELDMVHMDVTPPTEATDGATPSSNSPSQFLRGLFDSLNGALRGENQPAAAELPPPSRN